MYKNTNNVISVLPGKALLTVSLWSDRGRGLLHVNLLHGITHQVPQNLLVSLRKHWTT